MKMSEEYCDGCGNRISSNFVVDGDLLLCADCFLEIYKESIEELFGVVIQLERR